MKLNTLFVAAICAGTLLNSCVDKTARENQLKYTHTSLVDGDAFAFFQIVGEKALTGVKEAETAEGSADAKSKEVASKVKAFYNQLIPSLDSLATTVQVDFPIKGIPAAEEAHHDATTVDSTATATTDAHAGHNHSHADYVSHAQHEIAAVKDQLKRMTRNTNESIQKLAKEQLALATDLYTQIGGKEDAHAGH